MGICYRTVSYDGFRSCRTVMTTSISPARPSPSPEVEALFSVKERRSTTFRLSASEGAEGVPLRLVLLEVERGEAS